MVLQSDSEKRFPENFWYNLFIGVIAILLIILVQKQRIHVQDNGEVMVLFFGILPNFISALGFPFIGLLVFQLVFKYWKKLRLNFAGRGNLSHTKIFVFILLLNFLLLIIYEYLQIFLPKQTFDFNDIWVTLLGSFLSYLLFQLVTRKKMASVKLAEVK